MSNMEVGMIYTWTHFTRIGGGRTAICRGSNYTTAGIGIPRGDKNPILQILYSYMVMLHTLDELWELLLLLLLWLKFDDSFIHVRQLLILTQVNSHNGYLFASYWSTIQDSRDTGVWNVGLRSGHRISAAGSLDRFWFLIYTDLSTHYTIRCILLLSHHDADYHKIQELRSETGQFGDETELLFIIVSF